jgi:hypothetical protein
MQGKSHHVSNLNYNLLRGFLAILVVEYGRFGKNRLLFAAISLSMEK